MKYLIPKSPYLIQFLLVIITLTACQKNPDTATKSFANADHSSELVGCYTISKTEPAQIKITRENGSYSMQMREFNDPDKPWDKPEPLQTLPSSEIHTYFDVDEKSVEHAIIRPDTVFALAKIEDSLISLDKRFDSNYLGYIAKSETAKGNSTTVYKVECGK